MLEAPPTLRLAKAYEVPQQPALLARIEQGQQANIVEGFTIRVNESHELPFHFYAEVNVDNSRFWQAFLKLSETLPEPTSCIYGFYEEEPTYSEYQSKHDIFHSLQEFQLELAQDCYLEFGLIHQTDDKLVELFADNSKYFKYWGTDEVFFRRLLAELSIPEINDLHFYDEFPKVIVPLTTIATSVFPTEQVITSLQALL